MVPTSDPTVQLIDLIGAAALLLLGLRLIKLGVLRAFGATLRQWIARGTRNRVAAAFWGFLATLGLQSSTATAAMTGSFVARDILDPRMAQAVMLGANLGTAVVALILSRDIHWLGSALIAVGVVLSTPSRTGRVQAIGRSLLGLGLMLLALRLLGGVTEPLRHSPTLAVVMASLDNAPIFAVLLAAGLAVLGSSSLAVVFLIMALAGAGTISPALVVCLVAGANLGGAIPAYLAVAGEGVAARRLALSNLLVRAAGAVVATLFAGSIAAVLEPYLSQGMLAVGLHVLFNLTLLIVFLPLIAPLGRLMERLLPQGPGTEGAPSYLDDSLLATPGLALAVAAREALRLGDLVGQMLDRSEQSLRSGDEMAVQEVARLEREVDRLHEAIKLYVSRLGQQEMDAVDSHRASEIISYAINLEHVGDIVESGLAEIAAKRIRKRLTLSPEGLDELSRFFAHTRENLRLAQAIFLSRDTDLARQLINGKVMARKIEAGSAERHLARLRAGRVETIETSTIHLDLLRDLKRVNAHLASVAYPILEEIGALGESRLTPASKSVTPVNQL
ncbi:MULTISPECIES: Na/Pi cotransporter family protein [unclassified Haematobacter]|uniref:Na/Pi cotransporter family protein n=1 Tax=unclassified Haematobacter TaxID=2640585 RepID=UPI0025B97EE3|nr:MULTISPECIES: Na/Pi cotransporter family protein [unclassified Haematobacter]